MSAPAPISPDTAEAIAAAVAHAERRLWLLDLMTRFCMALLAVLKPGADAGLFFTKAYGAISRAVSLCLMLEAETDRLLRDLKAGILPAPNATLDMEEGEEREEREDLYDRESRDTRETESQKAFRARLEDLEALLDREGACRSPREMARLLCRVLGLDPEWVGWLGDDWLADTLTLTPLAGPAPAPPPPPRRASPPPRQPKPPNPQCGRGARGRPRPPPRRPKSPKPQPPPS